MFLGPGIFKWALAHFVLKLKPKPTPSTNKHYKKYGVTGVKQES